MRGLSGGAAKGGRTARAAQGARRVWPYVLMAWERWQAMPPEQKERYKRQARDYARRGQKALKERRKRRPDKR
jgi:hypothetical protein